MKGKNIVFVCLLVMACQARDAVQPQGSDGPKNVILMIGDGMGPSQLSMALDYRRVMQPDGKVLAVEELFSKNHSAKVRTYAVGSVLTDSAAAATAISCGVKTLPGILGKDATGKPCETILEYAKKQGKLTGVVSTMRVTHATPAAFFAHIVSRDDENAIAQQLVESGTVDVAMGGGFRHFSTKRFFEQKECQGGSKLLDGYSKRADGVDFLADRKSTHSLICTKKQMDETSFEPGKKILGTFAASHFPEWQERHALAELPSLAQMTQKSIEWLSGSNKGFFLMVEGGLIDYAGHANDAGTLLREVLDFDRAIGVAYDYIAAHPDTLLLVTADHATGGVAYTVRAALNEAERLNRKLPSGDIYTNEEIFPDGKDIFTKLLNQGISFQELLDPLVKRLYPEEKFDTPAPGVSFDEAVQELKSTLEKKSDYKITLEEAIQVLSPDHSSLPQWDMFHAYHHRAFLHAYNRLGLVLMPQNFIGWVSSDHTPEPVDLLCAGPEAMSGRCEGLVDNTDIYHIIKDALDGH